MTTTYRLLNYNKCYYFRKLKGLDRVITIPTQCVKYRYTTTTVRHYPCFACASCCIWSDDDICNSNVRNGASRSNRPNLVEDFLDATLPHVLRTASTEYLAKANQAVLSAHTCFRSYEVVVSDFHAHFSKCTLDIDRGNIPHHWKATNSKSIVRITRRYLTNGLHVALCSLDNFL